MSSDGLSRHAQLNCKVIYGDLATEIERVHDRGFVFTDERHIFQIFKTDQIE